MAKKDDKEKEENKEKEVKQIKADDLLDINVSGVKEELTNYMMNVIDKEVNKAVEKSTKKLVRHKNIIIIRRDIYIVILLIICLFLGYCLLTKSDIDIDISSKRETLETTNSEVEKEESVSDEKEELKEKYKHLTDDIFINEESPYLKDFYDGNLSDELKLYLAVNNINEDKIILEDDTLYIDEADLKEVYNLLFVDEFAPKSFKYGDLNFKYLSKGLFLAEGKHSKEKTNIVKNIIDVKEDGDSLEITTVEGLIKDDKLYNIVSDKEVKNYKNDGLEKYESSLTKMNYNFEKKDDVYRLSKLSLI
ncbi:MAG: hypothetical protein IKF82_07105 [Bacilli bacterium]|nr:hypothetical protein [Bacilli bacterium]